MINNGAQQRPPALSARQQKQGPRPPHPRRPPPSPSPARPPAPRLSDSTRRSLLLATTASTIPWWRFGRTSNPFAHAAALAPPPPNPPPTPASSAFFTPVAVPRGASPSDALREALVGRGLDRVALVLEPGATYDGVRLVVDRESRPYGAPAPSVRVLVGGDEVGGGSGTAATLRLDTKAPYARVLEVRGDGASLRAENLRVVHASKSVASNYAVLASAGAELELEGCEVTSTTGAGLAADGAGAVLLRGCSLSGCARQGLAAFGGSRDTSSSLGPAVVRLDACRVERNGAEGLLVRDGAAVLLSGACVVGGNRGAAGLRWFVVEEREAEVALLIAAAAAAGARGGGKEGPDGGGGGGQGGGGGAWTLIGPEVRFAPQGAQVVVDTRGGAGDETAAAALAEALGRGRGDAPSVSLV